MPPSSPMVRTEGVCHAALAAREATHWSDHLTTSHTARQHEGMPLQAVQRRSVPDDVFEQLVAEVTGGGLGPGESLPSERGWPRSSASPAQPSVRRCSGSPRPGSSTSARATRRPSGTSVGPAGLDLLPRLLVKDGDLDISVARSILEARLLIGPKVAEMAAGRGQVDEASLRETVRPSRRRTTRSSGSGTPSSSGSRSSTRPARSPSGSCSTACARRTNRRSRRSQR